jgi:hypothetical protein
MQKIRGYRSGTVVLDEAAFQTKTDSEGHVYTLRGGSFTRALEKKIADAVRAKSKATVK